MASIEEVRSGLHDLINGIQDQKVLEGVYQVLEHLNKKDAGLDFWDSLSDKQKQDLEQALEEVENEVNLISHQEVMQEAKGWLKK